VKLYDQVREKLRLLHYALDTEKTYLRWIDQYVRFHKVGDIWRHPRELREPEVEAFLTHLAVDRRVAASTQNQAFGAVLFLYQRVLEVDLGRVEFLRAKRPERLPVVLSAEEVRRVLAAFGRYTTKAVHSRPLSLTPSDQNRRALKLLIFPICHWLTQTEPVERNLSQTQPACGIGR
jgi:integrase